LLAGCSQTVQGVPAPVGAGGPVLAKYSTIEQLSTAIAARVTKDKTVQGTFSTKLTRGGTAQTEITGEAANRIDSAGTSAKISIRQTGGPTDLDGNFDAVALPTEFYVKLPPAQAIEPGKPWVRATPNGTDPVSKAMGPALAQIQDASDPLDNVTDAGATTIAGSTDEALDGTPAVRYVLRIDLTKGAKDASTSETFTKLGVRTLEPIVWLDGQDRLLRFELTVRSPAGVSTLEVSARYRAWGEPVDITPPPADQVATVPG